MTAEFCISPSGETKTLMRYRLGTETRYLVVELGDQERERNETTFDPWVIVAQSHCHLPLPHLQIHLTQGRGFSGSHAWPVHPGVIRPVQHPPCNYVTARAHLPLTLTTMAYDHPWFSASPPG